MEEHEPGAQNADHAVHLARAADSVLSDQQKGVAGAGALHFIYTGTSSGGLLRCAYAGEKRERFGRVGAVLPRCCFDDRKDRLREVQAYFRATGRNADVDGEDA